MRGERLYVVVYDISSPKRWRRVFRLMEGFGEWLQLSVFQCRLSTRRHAELIALLDGIIHHDDDHVILMDLGPADQSRPVW
jgi:CRISPR-associated protein Cas2